VGVVCMGEESGIQDYVDARVAVGDVELRADEV
jgi:hypothetical protein